MIDQAALAGAPVAILYQALPPPVIGGLRKDAKPGGYSDSGADIGFALAGAGVLVLTPVRDPDPSRNLDWVFPDTPQGIAEATGSGAAVLWANTVLFEGHPLELVLGERFVVGHRPDAVQRADDKFLTNLRLREAGLPVAGSFLAAHEARDGIAAVAEIDAALLARAGLALPLVVKPVRGRGSQGVTVVRSLAALHAAARDLLAAATFGDIVMIEEFLPGEELTVAVLPAGMPGPDGRHAQEAWCLPPVRRFDHHDDVAPYNGLVAVTRNSAALTAREAVQPAVAAVMAACAAATAVVDARTIIRIDCRAGADGRYRLFDLNMKPNLTGAGRPGREDQDSLCTIAAQAAGWTYADLLNAMLAGAWRERDGLVERLGVTGGC